MYFVFTDVSGVSRRTMLAVMTAGRLSFSNSVIVLAPRGLVGMAGK